ncbi:ATP-binding protein [Cupriavidus sp. L7L]|uniref:ATP-binding protein n=1 Tax=Cupriavidus sp. L7L TaxID=2546443 RepID=UPI0014043474|nr:ATP-binding protein [Cupriavidus sp. L7L]
MTPWRRVRALFPLPLFWRNFLTFWLGVAAIVGIGMALTAAVEWFNGCRGVPDDALPSLFEPFFRVRSGAGHPAGAGLGLSIAQAAIAAHGGAVTAHNAAPHGLAARICLPCHVVQAPEDAVADLAALH